jgi:hypothetical protein
MKRGAPKAKRIKVSPRARFAPLLSLEIPSMMRERLLLAAAGEVTLLPSELVHLAQDWQPKTRKGKPGAPPRRPAMLAPVEALAMARFYVWAAFAGRERGDMRGVPEAERATMRKFGCDRRTWERHKSDALDHQGGKWWPAACRLAHKGERKREALMHF